MGDMAPFPPNAAKMISPEPEVEGLLLVVDDSPCSKRAVQYVGKFLGHRRGFQIYLFRLIPPLPPALLEFGGAEDSQLEEKLEAELRRDQENWIASARESAKPALEEAAKVLHKAGVVRNSIHIDFSYPVEIRNAAGTLLEQARAKGCHTLVIGHTAHSWLREITGGDLAEHILRHAHGVSVWLVQ
jgi:nucleotide-binding universal stress UspA family protein